MSLAELRDELAERLPEVMEEKHQYGRDKYGDSWTEAHPDYPLRRSEEEGMENRQAVEHYRSREKALEELADYVNYRLMYIALSLPPGESDGG